MLALLTAIGAAPVALLHRSHGRAVRLALAPAYGLALGMCVLTTGLYAIPGYKLVFLGLIPLVVASLLVAHGVRRRRAPEDRPEPEPARRAFVQVAAVAAIVLAAHSWPLGTLATVGPIGGYAVADAAGYTAEIIGAQERSIRTTARTPGELSDLTLNYWRGISQGFQQIGFDAIEAPANELLRLNATDTLAPFLIALLAVIGLGIFAAVRTFTGIPSWAAVLAGGLAAGPLFLQLHMDGSQGAIVGQALILPFALAFMAALRHQRWQDLVLLGLLAGGIQTGYPLFVPPVVIACGAVLTILAIRHRQVPGRMLLGLGALIAIAEVVTPYAFSRNVIYWRSILDGSLSYEGLPVYDLPFERLIGWLLQTREFYELVPLADAPVTAAVIPFVLLGIAAFGVWKFRTAAWLLTFVGAAALLALYTAKSEGCSYCTQRNLLPTGPVIAALVGIGVTALATRLRGAGLVAGAVAAGWVGYMHLEEAERIRVGGYVVDPEIREVVKRVPDDASGAPVHIEGFGQTPKAPMEEPLAYHALNEQTQGPISIAAVLDDNRGQQYIGGRREAPGQELRPDYRWVFTRLGTVQTQRKTIARSGPIALQERASPVDVTIESGVSVPYIDVDPSGPVYLTPGVPLQLLVSGARPDQRTWVRIVLQELGALEVSGGPDVDARRLAGKRIEVCLRARGRQPARLAAVAFDGSRPAPGRPPRSEHEIAPPGSAARVVSVRASLRDCSRLRGSSGRRASA